MIPKMALPNFDQADNFFDTNKEQILRIFKYVQVIESWLMLKICSRSTNQKTFLEMFEKLKKKNIGVLIRAYGFNLKKKKDKKMFYLLDSFREQRNSFMHIFYFFIAIRDTKQVSENMGIEVLNSMEEICGKVIDYCFK